MNTADTTTRKGKNRTARRFIACVMTVGLSMILSGCGRGAGAGGGLGQRIRNLGGGNGQLLARAANGVALAGNITGQFAQDGGISTGILNTVQGGLTQAAMARGAGR